MWQEFYAKNAGRDFVVLSLAIDVQGAEVARLFVERAKATFPALVDSEARVPGIVGQKVIPLVYLVDEVGLLRFGGPGGPRPEMLRKIEEVLAEPVLKADSKRPSPPAAAGASPEEGAETIPALLRKSREHLSKGERTEALGILGKARKLDPENWLVRKQIWAIEHPEKFYEGKIDVEWQRGQMKSP